jgi:hypothetical protein
VPNGIPLNQGVTQTPVQPIPAPLTTATVQPSAGTTIAANLVAPAGNATKAPSPLISTATATVPSAAAETPAVRALRAGWMKKKKQVFAGKQHKPDSEDPSTVNHLNWYEATNFTRPYPGETKVLPASAFNKKAPATKDDDD